MWENGVGNFSPAMGARNQVGIGLSYRPASLCSLATQCQTRFLESISCPIAGLKFSTRASKHDAGSDKFREYWMIYRGPGFLAVVKFGSKPTPYPPSPVSKLDRRHEGRLQMRGNLLMEEGGRGLAWSRIPRPQESLSLYKSFNPVWINYY